MKKPHASARLYYRRSTKEWVLEIDMSGNNLSRTLRIPAKTPNDAIEAVGDLRYIRDSSYRP